MFAGMVFLSGITYKIIIPVLVVAVPACFGLWWYIQQDFQVFCHKHAHNYKKIKLVNLLVETCKHRRDKKN